MRASGARLLRALPHCAKLKELAIRQAPAPNHAGPLGPLLNVLPGSSRQVGCRGPKCILACVFACSSAHPVNRGKTRRLVEALVLPHVHTHTHAQTHTCAQARARLRASSREQAHAQLRARTHTHHWGSERAPGRNATSDTLPAGGGGEWVERRRKAGRGFL